MAIEPILLSCSLLLLTVICQALSLVLDMDTEPRDYCLHESFNATCRSGFVILMTSAVYGRMRLGRCINGDFNIGCSMNVLTYFDSQCSARETCDISVRNLVDIHPCQKDFMSYLEASYRCIEVSAVKDVIVCPREGSIRVSAPSGYIVHGFHLSRSIHSAVGSKTCPWTVSVRPGQRVQIKIIILGDEETPPSSHEDAILCSTLFVMNDVTAGVTEVAACAGRSRERHLYTSAGSQVTLYIARDLTKDASHVEHAGDKSPRFILSYEAIGCPELLLPMNSWSKRMGDNVMIKCNITLETFYLTCQVNKWIGEVGNCSQKGVPLFKGNNGRPFGTFPTHGIILAVLLGVALGIFIGIVLLLTVHCAKRRSLSMKSLSISMALNKEKKDNMAIQDGARRNGRTTESNYPSLILNTEKIYDFDQPGICKTCSTEHKSPYTARLQSQLKVRQDGGEYTCTRAHQCGTILRHCRCGGTSMESNLEREPLYDARICSSGSFFENFDLVSPIGVSSATDDDTYAFNKGLYPPGLRTPELLSESESTGVM